MTREEAIDVLKHNYPSSCFEDLCKAVDIAIKALSVQSDVPDINDGDMISRRAAIRWVKTECNPYGNPTLDFESGKKVIEHLEQMPSARPEQLTTWYHQNCNNEMVSGANSSEDQAWYKADDIYKALEDIPSAQPTLHGYNIKHLDLIARVLQKEDLPPERVVEALTDIGRIVAIVRDEFEEALRKAVEQCAI